MTEHPILFSAPMVRAILDGRKTMTRRIVKLDDGRRIRRGHKRWHPADSNAALGCPYGRAGSALWVRENYAFAHYFDGHKPSEVPAEAIVHYAATGDLSGLLKRPSIFMPRTYCRIKLHITGVRVERLQGISHLDSVAEGLTPISKDGGRTWKYGLPDRDGIPGTDDIGWPWSDFETDSCAAFRRLWDGLNAKRGAGWGTNPWVWVIEFERVEAGK